MDNLKIAFICIVLFSLSVALFILILATMNGSTYCGDCDAVPLWITGNKSILEVNREEETNDILVETKNTPIIFDFHLERREIYWVEKNDDVAGSTKIYRSWLAPVSDSVEAQGLQGSQPQLLAELEDCGALAVDWVHSHLYWADREWGTVELATLDGSHRRNVYSGNSAVSNIVVDPMVRKLFWFEKIKTRNKTHHYIHQLKSFTLLGGDVRILVPSMDWHPRDLQNSLVLDVREQRVYFLRSPRELVMCDYDGGSQAVVQRELPIPTTLSLTSNQLLWMNNKGEVFSMVKQKEKVYPYIDVCKKCEDTEKRSLLGFHPQLKAVDPNVQPRLQNVNFTEDCLLNYINHTEVCPCPFGYKANKMDGSCKEEGFLLAAFDSIIQGLTVKGVKMTMHYKAQTHFPDFDFHYVRQLLFWHDFQDGKIYKAPMFHLGGKVTVALRVKGTAGVAVDWVYDHLYWTNNNLQGGSVEVCKLDGGSRIELIPRNIYSKLMSITVDPLEGLMYISNWTQGSIEVVGMDGNNLQTLVTGGMNNPRSLTLDYQQVSPSNFQARKLFWLESYKGEPVVLRACNLQNNVAYPLSCPKVFSKRGSGRPSSMTLFNNRLYWLDPHNIHSISVSERERVHPKRMHVTGKHTESYSLRTYHSHSQPQGKNYCQWGTCTRQALCLPTASHVSDYSTRCISRQQFYFSHRTYSGNNNYLSV